MDKSIEAIVTIATAIIGVAIIAVLVSNKSNTSSILTNAGNAFSGALKAAEMPITG
jgi:hypothetical protein